MLLHMAFEHSTRRYRQWYAMLLQLYPKPYYDRFCEGMEQTFNDLLRERSKEESGLFGYALRMFVETFAEIMRENMTSIMKNKNILWIPAGTAFILFIPLVAMQFTDEVNWNLFDFIVMGALVFGTGLAYELVSKKGDKTAYRVAVGVALAGTFLLFWVNGAVGIIGNEGNPANMMYSLVFVVGIIGVFFARFEPRGMARTLFAMALAQMLVPVVALIVWPPPATSWSPGVAGVFVLSGFFAMVFVVSAMLFHRAGIPNPA